MMKQRKLFAALLAVLVLSLGISGSVLFAATQREELARTDAAAQILPLYNAGYVGVRNAAPSQKDTDYNTSVYLTSDGGATSKILYYASTYDGSVPEAAPEQTVDFTQFDTADTATYLQFYLWIDSSAQEGGSLAGTFNVRVGLTNYLESGYGQDVSDYRFWRTTALNTAEAPLQDGAWHKVLIRASSLTAPAWGDASASKTGLAVTSTFGIRVGEMGAQALSVLIHDVSAVSAPADTASCVAEVLESVSYDASVPAVDTSSVDGQTFTIGQTVDLMPGIPDGASVTATVKNAMQETVAALTGEGLSSFLLDESVFSAGRYTVEYAVLSSFGTPASATAAITVTGSAGEVVPEIDFSAVSARIMAGESVSLKPDITYPSGEASDYAVTYSLTGPEGFEAEENVEVTDEAQWTKTFTLTGTYTWTVAVTHRTQPSQTAQARITLEVVPGPDSSRQTFVTMTEIQDHSGSLEGERSYSPAGEGVSYYVTSVPAGGILNLMFYFQAVDLTQFNAEYATLSFWVYVDGAELTQNAAGLHILDQNGASRQLGWFHEWPGFEYGKWCKVSVSLSEALTGSGFDASKVNTIQFYYHISASGNFRMLLSGFCLEESGQHGIVQVLEEQPDLQGPVAVLPADQTGEETDAFDLRLAGTDEDYAAGTMKIVKNGQTVDEIDFTPDTMAETLQAFSFAAYGTGSYTVTYLLTDLYGNSAESLPVTVTVTGKPDVDLSALTAFVEGDEVSIAPVITYMTGTAEDYVVTYSLSGPAGFTAETDVEVTDPDQWTKTFTQIGSYTLTVTVTHRSGLVEEVTAETVFEVTAGPDESRKVEAQNVTVTDEVSAYRGTRTIVPEGEEISYYFGGFRNAGSPGVLNVALEFDPVDLTQFNAAYPTLWLWVYAEDAEFTTNSAGIVFWDENGAKYEGGIFFHNLEGFESGKWCRIAIDLRPLLTAPQFLETAVAGIQFYYHMDFQDDFVLFLSGVSFGESRTYGVVDKQEIGEYTLTPPQVTISLEDGAYSQSFDLYPTVTPDNGATVTAEIYQNGNLIDQVEGDALRAYSFLTGGTYQISYTVTDRYGNVATLQEELTVTGTNPEAKAVIKVPSDFATEIYLDRQVNLSGITAEDYAGNALEVSFSVTAPDGSAVTLSAGKFMAAQTGTYRITVSAGEGDLRSEQTLEILVTEEPSDNTGGCGCGGSAAGAGGVFALFAVGLSAAVCLKKKEKNS